MPEHNLQLGLVGAGRWGRNYVRTIAALDGLRLAAIASRNPETASLVPPDCRIVADWHELLAISDLDGVIIASPPATHAEILLAAIAAGKPLLAEKPVVQSRVDAESVRRALARRDAIVLVEHTHLFHPAFRALQREAASAPIRAIRASAGNRGPYRADVSVLWDWAPHDLAMCLTLVPDSVSVARATRTVGQALEERVNITLNLADDVAADLALSNMDDRHRWFAAEQDAGTLVFRDFVPGKLVRLAPGENIYAPGQPIPVSDELPLTRAVLDFADMIRRNDINRASIDLGLRVVDLIGNIDAMLKR